MRSSLRMLFVSLLVIFASVLSGNGCFAAKADTYDIFPARVDKWSPGLLEIRFFAVGKGDAVLLHMPDGKFVMIDTGYAETASDVVSGLKKIGVDRISLLILTHHHKDHAGGFPYIVEAFPVEKVVQAYDRREIGKNLVKPGTRLMRAGGVSLTALGPTQSFEDENEASLVVRLDFNRISVLFAADILEESQKGLEKSGAKLRADLLKVPHHGRFKGFSPREFFAAVKPEFAVITSDEKAGDPPEGSVIRILEEFGARVLLTDERGDLQFMSDGETLDFISGGKK